MFIDIDRTVTRTGLQVLFSQSLRVYRLRTHMLDVIWHSKKCLLTLIEMLRALDYKFCICSHCESINSELICLMSLRVIKHVRWHQLNCYTQVLYSQSLRVDRLRTQMLDVISRNKTCWLTSIELMCYPHWITSFVFAAALRVDQQRTHLMSFRVMKNVR